MLKRTKTRWIQWIITTYNSVFFNVGNLIINNKYAINVHVQVAQAT